MSKKYTNKFLDLVQDGEVEVEDAFHMLLRWMTDADVAQAMYDNELIDDDAFDTADDDASEEEEDGYFFGDDEDFD